MLEPKPGESSSPQAKNFGIQTMAALGSVAGSVNRDP